MANGTSRSGATRRRRRNSARILILSLLGLLCGRVQAETTPPAPANPAVTGAMSDEIGHAMSSTPAVSEEEFRKANQPADNQPVALRGGPVTVDGATCYLSLPPGQEPPFPGIVVVHEWWGLNDHIKLWTDRLAALGYAAVAVDLYDGRVADNPDSARALTKRVDPHKAVALLLAAQKFLREDPRVKAPRTAAIGWCFGGGYSLQLALHAPDLNASIVYYGHLVTDPGQLKAIHGPLLGIFGNQDRSIPPDSVAAFESGLNRAGVKNQIFRYDAPHAFANPSGGGYHEAAAADAWRHVQEFLAHNLRP